MRKKEFKKRFLTGFLSMAMALSVMSGVAGKTRVKAAGTASDVVSTAVSQIGYHEKASNYNLDNFTGNSGSANYNKYARDIGVANGQPWCTTFVIWCMSRAGVPSSRYSNSTWVPTMKNWFANQGLYRARGSYTPKGGDVIFLSNLNHVGLVEYVSGNTVWTVEGNTSDCVARKYYNLGSATIVGYGAVNYSGAASSGVSDNSNPGSPYPIPSGNFRSGSRGDCVKWIQQCLNAVRGAGLTVDGIYGNNTIAAVKGFQSCYGLTADGITGSQTTAKMLAVWRDKVSDKEAPKISNVKITEVSDTGYRVTCTVSDNKGVTTVKFPTWTDKDDQDDLIWHVGTVSGSTASFYVKRSDHKNEYGKYITHIYAYDAKGNYGKAETGVTLKKYCTVTFKDGGTVISTQKVEEGKAATAPYLAKAGYKLSWDKAFNKVTGNLTVNAVWTKLITYYNVTFMDGGSVISTQKVEEGKAATAPYLAKAGYTLSWDKDFNKITGNLTVNAVWTKLEEPTTAEEETTTEEPSTAEEETTAEEPSTAEEKTATEEPSTAEEETTAEEPTTAEEETTTEEPTTAEEKTATEEPTTAEEPTTKEDSASTEDYESIDIGIDDDMEEEDTLPETVGTKLRDKKNKCQVIVTDDNPECPTVTYVKSTKDKAKKIVIPDKVTVDGITYLVTGIKDRAFKNNKRITTVTIGRNVKKIGKEAFCGCKKLYKITFNSKVMKKIGKNAFKGISDKKTFYVPKGMIKKYKKLLKKSGAI